MNMSLEVPSDLSMPHISPATTSEFLSDSEILITTDGNRNPRP